MQRAPVLATPPVFGFIWVHPPAITVCFVKHPIVQVAKSFCGNDGTEVVGPPSNDRVEFRQRRLEIASSSFYPQVLQLLLNRLYCFFAGFNQEFPSRLGGLWGWVQPDVETQEIKSFGQMKDTSFFPPRESYHGLSTIPSGFAALAQHLLLFHKNRQSHRRSVPLLVFRQFHFDNCI